MSRRVVLSVTLGALLTLLAGGLAASQSILSAERLRQFYASGGKPYLGKAVHIHLPASIFKKNPHKVRLPGGKYLLCFENRSVPILVNARNIYYRRLMRKMREKGGVKGLVCLKGIVVRPEWDLKGRCFLRIRAVKTYGGRLPRSGS